VFFCDCATEDTANSSNRRTFVRFLSMGRGAAPNRGQGGRDERRRKRTWTSGRVFVCHSFKSSLCQDEALECVSVCVCVCVCVCGCIHAWFGVRSVSRRPSAPNRRGDFHVLDFQTNILEEIKRRRREEKKEEGEKTRGRGTEEALNPELCCCWHLSQRFSCEEAGLTGSGAL